jgi:hypothetical protein
MNSGCSKVWRMSPQSVYSWPGVDALASVELAVYGLFFLKNLTCLQVSDQPGLTYSSRLFQRACLLYKTMGEQVYNRMIVVRSNQRSLLPQALRSYRNSHTFCQQLLNHPTSFNVWSIPIQVSTTRCVYHIVVIFKRS